MYYDVSALRQQIINEKPEDGSVIEDRKGNLWIVEYISPSYMCTPSETPFVLRSLTKNSVYYFKQIPRKFKIQRDKFILKLWRGN